MKLRNFFIPTSIVLLCLMLSSCDKESGSIKGQGPVVQQSFVLPTISAIALNIDANVILTHGDTEEILIEGQQNIIDNIEKYVTSDGYWNISYFKNVRSSADVTIHVTSSLVDYISIGGSGSVNTTNFFADSVNVYLNISGSGNISFNTIAQLTDSFISGSGEIYLTGSSYEHRIHISGSGNLRAFNFPTYNTHVDISGSGNSEVNVENQLDVKISGSGNVYYVGNPQITSDISGSGGIYNANK
jgi:hypothetical protein